jgi:hypothetical protein
LFLAVRRTLAACPHQRVFERHYTLFNKTCWAWANDVFDGRLGELLRTIRESWTTVVVDLQRILAIIKV